MNQLVKAINDCLKVAGSFFIILKIVQNSYTNKHYSKICRYSASYQIVFLPFGIVLGFAGSLCSTQKARIEKKIATTPTT